MMDVDGGMIDVDGGMIDVDAGPAEDGGAEVDGGSLDAAMPFDAGSADGGSTMMTDRGGCGCVVPGSRGGFGPLAWAALLAPIALLARKRRRSGRGPTSRASTSAPCEDRGLTAVEAAPSRGTEAS
jgi:hypothetical protein